MDEEKTRKTGLKSLQTLESVQEIVETLQDHILVERVATLDGSGQLQSLAILRDQSQRLVRISEPTNEAEIVKEAVRLDPVVTGAEETMKRLHGRLDR